MRAAVLFEIGDVPVPTDFADPHPYDQYTVGEVLVAGLNPVDLAIADGRFGVVEVPCVTGLEGIARLPGGRRVYFNGAPARWGSMAERAPIDPDAAFDVPAGLDEGLAVSLGIAGLAAWLALEWQARLRSGERVLVLGASGVVGQIAVQGAKLLGAGHVVAAARHRPALERLRERGADEIVVLGADALGEGFDVVIDPLFGAPLEEAVRATVPGARIVSVGASAGPAATLRFAELYGRSLIAHANGAAPLEVRRAAYGRMAGHAAAGEIAVEVERIPLDAVADAWARQAAGPHHKLVLVP